MVNTIWIAHPLHPVAQSFPCVGLNIGTPHTSPVAHTACETHKLAGLGECGQAVGHVGELDVQELGEVSREPGDSRKL